MTDRTEGSLFREQLIAGVKQRMQQARQLCPFFQLEQHAADSPSPRPLNKNLLLKQPLVLPELDQLEQTHSLQPVQNYPAWVIRIDNSPSAELLQQLRTSHPEHYLIARDWIVDEYQILQARIAGANALTLSNSLLGIRRTQVYLNKIRFWEMEPFFEAHGLEDLHLALELKVKVLILTAAPGSQQGWTTEQLESAGRLLDAFNLLIYRGSEPSILSQLSRFGISALMPEQPLTQLSAPQQQLEELRAYLEPA